MGKINIGKTSIPFGEIKKGNWPTCTPYIDQSLAFCQAWLNGAASFQLNTSGSTGAPKTIDVNRQQMEISANATGKFFDIKPQANLLCCLNTTMIAGKMMLVRGLEWDSTIYLEEPSGTPLANFGALDSFDFVAMVPAQVENSLLNSAEKLNSIQHLIIGGASLSQKLQKEVSQLSCNAYQTYGMTETVSHIALAKITGLPPLTYQTLPGVAISTTKDSRLVINAPMAKTTLTTNDIVTLPAANTFIWEGRSDFTINSGGIKIQPEKLEAQIAPIMEALFPGKRFFVAGAPSDKWGEEVVLVIETPPVTEASDHNLSVKIAETFSKYERPKKVYFIENFSETASGKIKRSDSLKQALDKFI
ncbi:acyl-CoA synthetase [Echinicola strongylocentroti]|uniref:Acyl-CoA synthetase n=1 Tax=Echinicola strongylocentroti TaxID=1795355 RepID=A0A2Z4ILC8_9BACT|nr:AMP-binding protein [Echinicola strongylocentroti]AWW31745.1 acyl-CoA synthetase [Echinicola strongylocentroti]